MAQFGLWGEHLAINVFASLITIWLVQNAAHVGRFGYGLVDVEQGGECAKVGTSVVVVSSR